MQSEAPDLYLTAFARFMKESFRLLAQGMNQKDAEREALRIVREQFGFDLTHLIQNPQN